jgi:7-cyano-7-deazaguanine tRNA-ribosyltransferase
VDERCRGHPQLLKGYRALLNYGKALEGSDRVSKRRFFYRGAESCERTEVIRFQALLDRLVLPSSVLISLDGREFPGFDLTLPFKPPFGPFMDELRETFPIGQSEIPDWDEVMVASGCRGILRLVETHRECRIVVSCQERWRDIVERMVPGIEVIP